jgi:hypothetical protein
MPIPTDMRALHAVAPFYGASQSRAFQAWSIIPVHDRQRGGGLQAARWSVLYFALFFGVGIELRLRFDTDCGIVSDSNEESRIYQ